MPDMPYPARGLARAHAYVAYAQAHPGMYGLMFRTERLDYSRPSLNEAAQASFGGLAQAIAASRHEHIEEQALTLEQAAAIAALNLRKPIAASSLRRPVRSPK